MGRDKRAAPTKPKPIKKRETSRSRQQQIPGGILRSDTIHLLFRCAAAMHASPNAGTTSVGNWPVIIIDL